MGSLHAMHPNATLSVHEQSEVFENFSHVHFEDFVTSHAIEVQSRRNLRNGTERKNSVRRLGETWEMHLRRFLRRTDINLPQMIRNYRDERVSLDQKKHIYSKLREIGLEGLTKEDELEREALLLGLLMMLSDNFEAGISLMTIFENEGLVSQILDDKKAVLEA